jgi:DNA-binding HxlR family transcriptional regulator
VYALGVDKEPRSDCPISLALEAIGDRWSLLILRDLMMRSKTRYQEFLASEEGIATNILADRLAQLERRGLIAKTQDPSDRRQFRYAPTQKALDLLPVIFEMGRWSLKYGARRHPAHPVYRWAMAGRETFIREIVSRLGRPAPAEPGARPVRPHPRGAARRTRP